MIEPTAGEIVIDGQDVLSMSEEERNPPFKVYGVPEIRPLPLQDS